MTLMIRNINQKIILKLFVNNFVSISMGPDMTRIVYGIGDLFFIWSTSEDQNFLFSPFKNKDSTKYSFRTFNILTFFNCVLAMINKVWIAAKNFDLRLSIKWKRDQRCHSQTWTGQGLGWHSQNYLWNSFHHYLDWDHNINVTNIFLSCEKISLLK